MDKDIHHPFGRRIIPMTSIESGTGRELLPDIYCFTIQIVNVCLIGRAGTGTFVLVDAGMPGSAGAIFSAVRERFGEKAKPKAVLLTHGHFDHVGAIAPLLEKWDVPVFAHPLELPYLTGRETYPDPDPTVEGGLLAKISMIYPNEPVDLGKAVQPLPEDGTVPFLPGWKWIHTPGHSNGHVSFFREADNVLIAGDAFITVRQDEFWKVLVQKQEVNGPPRYFTNDWKAAKRSVEKLAALKPETALCGHGIPMSGAGLREGLESLVSEFDEIALPDHGKYVDGPQ
ncbi:MBL fold metallo-hydrolase [Heyndrickxia coagulans]|uniref:MBL fold metallo-hydrolase n=1 Tax=Heyndrickxia coagulans TaxID=1398 RepID=UPI002E1AA8DF|nr:MBL fold metallo-hydrolase [Heyndrickxia coagulans]MED4964610.1 MBL fold metallo-hydrolase [Heyndrickxia coagulans]